MANPDSTRTSRVLLSLGFVIGIAVILFGVRAFTHTQVAVRVVPVRYGDLISTIPTNGKVEPVHFFQAHALVPGLIEKIDVKINQHVAAGTLLITMNDTEARARLAAAQVGLAANQVGASNISHSGSVEERQRLAQEIAIDETDQRNASADLATTQRLAAQGAASQGELLRAQQRLQAVQATLSNARSRTSGRYDALDRTESGARLTDSRAAIASAQQALAAVDIRTPIAGTVYSIPVSPYDYVNVAEDLIDVADLNHLLVRAYFDEPDIGKLANGQAVSISWDARPNLTWTGHIQQAPTTVTNYGTRNVGECLIAVDDTQGGLLPNTNVTVKVTTSQRMHVLTIPREALHTEGAADFVYRIVNGHLLRTAVKVGILNLTDVEILSGLTDHDTVVLGPTVNGVELSDGMQVQQVR